MDCGGEKVEVGGWWRGLDKMKGAESSFSFTGGLRDAEGRRGRGSGGRCRAACHSLSNIREDGAESMGKYEQCHSLSDIEKLRAEGQ